MLDIFGSKHNNLEYSEFLTGFLQDFFPNFPIWFLLALFGVNIFAYILHMLSQKVQHSTTVFVSVSVLLAVLYLEFASNWGGHYVKSIMQNLPFFTIGYCIFRHTSLLQPNTTDRYLPLFILFALGVLWFFKNHWIPFEVSLYVCGLAGIYVIVMLSKWIGYLPLISYIGCYSIMLLVTHSLVFQCAQTAIRWIPMTHTVRYLVALTFSLLSYYAIIPFMKRFMPYVTAQKDVIKI